MKILVIEDNKIMAEAIKYILKFSLDRVSEVISCNSLANAQEKINDFDYDLIITDLNLPDSDETKTFEFILSLNDRKPKLLISGSEFLSSENEISQNNNIKFISKDDNFNSNLEKAVKSYVA